MRHAPRGVTLIELMIVVVVIAILASIGIPSYRAYMIRAHRTEATAALLRLNAAQEKFYLQNNAYTDNVAGAPPAGLGLLATTEGGFYTIAVDLDAGAQGYTATATPVAGAGQDDDEHCTAFAIDHTGQRAADGSGGVDGCWK